MSYNKKERSIASRKGWATRRKKLPDFGVSNSAGSIPSSDTEDLAIELPTSRLFEAGGMAQWDDPVYQVDPAGYNLIHNCAPVVESINKLGIRISKLDWSVVGTGPRAEAIAEILDLTSNWTDMIQWLTWAMVDGVRFMQIKTDATDPRWTVPSFFMGGRRKYNAGGDMQWDGTRIMQVQDNTGVAVTDAKELPISQFIIHRPGAGSSPEGDLQIGLSTYKIAKSWEDARKHTDSHMELFSVPIMVFKNKISDVRPDRVQSALSTAASKLQNMRNNKSAVISDEQLLELIEPKGKGFVDMVEYCKYLEGLIDQMFLGNQLTSSVSDASRTGNTSVHLMEESEVVFAGAMVIAESLNRHLLPWIIEKNPDIPELEEGEREVYFFPQSPNINDETDSQDVNVDASGVEDEIPVEETDDPIDDSTVEPTIPNDSSPDDTTSIDSVEPQNDTSNVDAEETDVITSKEEVVALNGAQVTALSGIVQQVGAGELPLQTAVILILKAFPSFTEEEILAMLQPAIDAPSQEREVEPKEDDIEIEEE